MAGVIGGAMGGMAGDTISAESQTFQTQSNAGIQSIGRQAGGSRQLDDAELKKLDQQIAQLKGEISAKPAVKRTLSEMNLLRGEHQKRLESRAQSLSKSFNINQWKVSRKK